VTEDELDRELDCRREALRARITVLLGAVDEVQREMAAIDLARWPGRRTRHGGLRVLDGGKA
jgi:hypothetical protein